MSEFKRLSVRKRREGKLGLGLCPQTDGGADTVPEFDVPGKEIGMEMGEKDVVDVPTVRRGVVQILLNIALRVDHHGGSRRLIGDEIGAWARQPR